MDATLATIQKNHPDIDLILLTGDIPAHDVWQQSKEYNLYTIEVVAKAFEKYFPNIPVLPAVGNHEGFPVNMFPGNNRMFVSVNIFNFSFYRSNENK